MAAARGPAPHEPAPHGSAPHGPARRERVRRRPEPIGAAERGPARERQRRGALPARRHPRGGGRLHARRAVPRRLDPARLPGGARPAAALAGVHRGLPARRRPDLRRALPRPAPGRVVAAAARRVDPHGARRSRRRGGAARARRRGRPRAGRARALLPRRDLPGRARRRGARGGPLPQLPRARPRGRPPRGGARQPLAPGARPAPAHRRRGRAAVPGRRGHPARLGADHIAAVHTAAVHTAGDHNAARAATPVPGATP